MWSTRACEQPILQVVQVPASKFLTSLPASRHIRRSTDSFRLFLRKTIFAATAHGATNLRDRHPLADESAPSDRKPDCRVYGCRCEELQGRDRGRVRRSRVSPQIPISRKDS